jgi:hypothetical protein
MTTSLIDADSLLAIDVGSVTTRAMLFDLVDGRYRFLGAGAAPTTAGAPFRDIGEGVRGALDQLQTMTGRVLVGQDQRLIIPGRANGTGVDTCVATLSVGDPLKVVAVGLLEDISVESAQHLATTTYAQVVDKLSLNDRRRSAARLDTLLRLRPDLVIVAGGTDGGASQSVLNLLESVGLACYRMPKEQRPEILFVGNQALVDEVDTAISPLAHLSTAPNIRPTLEIEQLAPAQAKMAQIYRSIRVQKIPGVQELDGWTGGRLMPTASAFARMIRFLDMIIDSTKGALGIDIGASATVATASFANDYTLGVYPYLGLGKNLPGILNHTSLEEIARWMPVEVSEKDLRDYIYNKAIHPGLLPATLEAQAIEQALARSAMQIALHKLSSSFPKKGTRAGYRALPLFEPIVAAGSIITQAPTRGQSLLMLLDGLQPSGVTTIVLDQNNILPSLGAAASINHVLPIQIVESGSFLNLSMVISLVGHSQVGAPALRLRIKNEAGEENVVEVKYGALEVISLPQGQPANVYLQPLNRFDVGFGPGRSGGVKVTGGALGLVIDARGRPLRLPSDPGRRRDLLKKWQWIFGG